MTGEFELALACCRWGFSSDCSSEIACLSSRVDWPRFLHTIRRHRVQGVVARAFGENRISPPAAVADAISQDASAIAQQNLKSARECELLLDTFAKAQVPLLFIKGLTLSALAYGDPFVKMATDVDLLVEARSLDEAATLLTKSGYQPARPAVAAPSPALSAWHHHHKESVWQKPGIASVDLHTRLADNPALIPSIGMTSPRQEVRIASDITLPTLTNDDLFAYLCVHGASSAWFRLKWIADLAALVHRIGTGQTERLYRHSQAQRAGRAAAQALLLADWLALLNLPDAFRDELRTDPSNRLVSRAALGQLLNEREPTRRLLGTASIRWTQPLLLEGWKFKLSEVTRQVADIAHRTR